VGGKFFAHRWRSGGRIVAAAAPTGGPSNGNAPSLHRLCVRLYLDDFAGCDAGGLYLEALAMSAFEGILLAVITLGSCLASYNLGQRNMFRRMRDLQERRRRWQEWEDFED
jgi:hypothetical protein